MKNRIQHNRELIQKLVGNGFEPLEARLVLTHPIQACLDADEFLYQNHSPDVAAQTTEQTAPTTEQTEPNQSEKTGNSFRDAINLGTIRHSKQIQDYVGRGDRKDIYRFRLQVRSEVDIHLHNLEADAELKLLDRNRDLIQWSLKSGTSSESIKTELESGSYFIRIDAFDANNSTNYQLDLTARDVREDTGGNTIETATDLGVLDEENGIRVAGWVGTGDRWDYYRFVAEQFINLRGVLNRLTANADLYLYDLDHNLIDSSTKSGKFSDRITRDVSPGVYVFGVQTFGSNTSYQLVASAEPKETDGRLANVEFFGTNARDQDLNAIYAPEAWNAGITGKDVVVAVIDSGVDQQHRDLKGQSWINLNEIAGDGIDNDNNGFIDDVNGWDFSENDNSPTDENGHGTHVAGIIASARNKFGATGIAYNAKIMAVRVLDQNGDGGFGDLAKGIYYAVDNGADVINLSIGGEYNYSVRAAIQYAHANGVFVSVAAGNGGLDMPLYPARHSASLSNTLSVGAHNRSDAHLWFSNYVGQSESVQVDAPGARVYSTLPNNRYGRYSGTSSAAPFVSGLAALVLSVNKEFSPNLVRHLITEGAIRDIQGSDSIGGIDAARTLYLAREFSGDPMGGNFGSGDDGSGTTPDAFTNLNGQLRVQKQNLVDAFHPIASITSFASLHSETLNIDAFNGIAERAAPIDGQRSGIQTTDPEATLVSSIADNQRQITTYSDVALTVEKTGSRSFWRSQAQEENSIDHVMEFGLEHLG